MRRRRFVQAALAAVGLGAMPRLGRATAWQGPPPPAEMPQRALGRTGVSLPIVGLGGAHLAATGSPEAARALVDAALEEGVVLFDNAESYGRGDAEEWMGAALQGRRDRVFLMSKTHEPKTRSADSARAHLEGSLRRLRTDHLDLWQLHSVKSREDVDLAFRDGGAFEAIEAAKRDGSVRFIGVTGHRHPRANRAALEWFDRGRRFDVMQLPVNPIDALQVSFQRELLPELERRGIGVIAMKTAAGGKLREDALCTNAECLRWAWSQEGVDVAVIGMETPAQLRENVALARAFRPMDEAERSALLARLEPRAALSLEWYKRA